MPHETNLYHPDSDKETQAQDDTGNHSLAGSSMVLSGGVGGEVLHHEVSDREVSSGCI